MVGTYYTESDISKEMKEAVGKYIKTVLINAKRNYYHALCKIDKYGISIYDFGKIEANYSCEDKGFSQIDMECFWLDGEPLVMEKSNLTDALQCLTRLQLEILLKTVLTDKSQTEIAEQYGISTRMVRKHTLTNMGKVKTVYLQELTDAYAQVGSLLSDILKARRWQ